MQIAVLIVLNMSKDIKTIQKLLTAKGEKELAKLLNGSVSEVISSGTFGHYANSTITSFDIFVPIKSYVKLLKISEIQKDMIYQSILDIYPQQANSPEIVDVRFRVKKDEGEISRVIKIKKRSDSIFIFISYSSLDKEIANQIRDFLSKFELEVFLAHDDIEISEEWKQVILQKLFECNVFIPLLTNNFKGSDWTSQEIGIVVGKRDDTLILPIKIEIVPYGFISHVQGKGLGDNSDEIIKKISLKFPELMFQKLLSYLEASGGFRIAERRLNIVLGSLSKPLSTKQVNMILKVALRNGQIWDASECVNWIRSQLENNEEIERDLFREFLKLEPYKDLKE